MRQGFVFSIIVVVCVARIIFADTFGTGANQFEIEFVNICGDSGDLGSWAAGNGYTFSGVNHGNYCMGKFEITSDQWNKFKAEIYPMQVTGSPSYAYDQDPYIPPGSNWPAYLVSWYEAAQFINWLNTSTGHQAAYKFTGTQGTSDYTFTAWEPEDLGYNPKNPFRNSNAYYFMPTEDEWIKTAYWNGESLQTWASVGDVVPTQNEWNFSDMSYPSNPDSPWNVGSGYEELNGTFDMMGNVSEWIENTHSLTDNLEGSPRVLRGGSYYHRYVILYSVYSLSSFSRPRQFPGSELDAFGFRVASVLSDENFKPIAHAGVDQMAYAFIDGYAEVILDGTGSTDPDGDVLEYYWYDANELIAEGAEPNVVLPIGEHVIDLVVNDGVEDSGPASCVVTVIEAIEIAALMTPQVLNRDSGRPHVIGRLEFAGEQMPVLDPNEPMLLFAGQEQIEDQRQMLDYSKKEDAWYLAGFFDNAALMEAIIEDGDIEITLAAKLLTGQWMFGTDIVTVK